MKNRLIELLKAADGRCDDTKQCENCVGFGHGSECVNYLIADHLLANGVFVPFAEVGTDIYGAFEWSTDEVLEGIIVSYTIQRDGTWFYCIYSNGLNMWHNIKDFGKTIFLTKEEAEKALAERSKT